MTTEKTINTQDYIDAPSGIGPLAATWADKPHRLVYDLANEVKRLRDRLTSLGDDCLAIHKVCRNGTLEEQCEASANLEFSEAIADVLAGGK